MGSESARSTASAARTRASVSRPASGSRTATMSTAASATAAAPTSSAPTSGEEPLWHSDLAHANSVIAGSFFDEKTIRRRAGLLRDVKQKSSSPFVWVQFLLFLNSERRREQKNLPTNSSQREAMYRALLTLYSRAVRVVPMTAANRHSPTYLQLWLDLALLQAEDPESQDEARNIFKLIKMQRIGHDIPALYETWAKFEDSCKNHAKAAKLRADAARCRPVLADEHATTTPASKTPASHNTAVTPATMTSTVQMRSVTPAPTSTSDARTRPPPFRSDRKAMSQPTPQEMETPANTYTGNRFSHALRTDVSTPAQGSALRPVAQPQSLTRSKTSPHVSGPTEKSAIGGKRTGKENVAPHHPGSPEVMRSIERPTGAAVAAEREKQLRNAEYGRSKYDVARRERQERYNSARRREEAPVKSDVDVYASAYSSKQSPQYGKQHSPPLNDPIFARDEIARCGGRDRLRTHHHDSNNNSSSPGNDLRSGRELSQRRRERDAARHANPFASLMSSDSIVVVNKRSYIVLGALGKGGSSQVYKVLSQDHQVLALKRVRVSPSIPGALESYANEIELLKRLAGLPTIVQLHDAEVQKQNGLIHVVMECGEVDLAKLLSRKKGKTIPENIMRVYWEQMLESVHTIHEERIVHGDLKPANFLSVSGSLKLIDFGIAKAIVAEDTTKIIRDSQVGTPNYMSPEALSAMEEDDESDNSYDDMHPRQKRYRVGRASDIWSLGCILYQMVYGKTPFAHIKNTIQKLHRIQDPQYEIQFRPIKNPLLLDVLRGCLQRAPEKRLTIPQLQNHPFLCPVEMPPIGMLDAGRGRAAKDLLARDGLAIVNAKTGAAPSSARVEAALERMLAALQMRRRAEVGQHGDDAATHSMPRLATMTPTSSGITATARAER